MISVEFTTRDPRMKNPEQPNCRVRCTEEVIFHNSGKHIVSKRQKPWREFLGESLLVTVRKEVRNQAAGKSVDENVISSVLDRIMVDVRDSFGRPLVLLHEVRLKSRPHRVIGEDWKVFGPSGLSVRGDWRQHVGVVLTCLFEGNVEKIATDRAFGKRYRRRRRAAIERYAVRRQSDGAYIVPPADHKIEAGQSKKYIHTRIRFVDLQHWGVDADGVFQNMQSEVE